jgi:hypothetical protein
LLGNVNEHYDMPVNGKLMQTFDNNYNVHFCSGYIFPNRINGFL